MPERPSRDPRRLRATPGEPVTLVAPGRVAYDRARTWQRDLAQRRASGEIGDVLLLVEHPPVYTTGRRADEANLLLDAAERARRGIELHRTDRGGDVTYHGPGQLVGYPVLRLADRRVVDYVRALEAVNLRLTAGLGVSARRVAGHTGVWVGRAKLTAIGVRVLASRVTQHGWATNVTPSMTHWNGIVACGITDADKTVGSLASLGAEASVATVAADTAAVLGELYDTDVEVRTDVP